MFGTIATCRVKPGMEEGFLETMEEWGRGRGSEIEGPVRVYVARSVRDPNVLLNIVLFDSKEHYEANAADPEQDKWYQRMVANLEAPPEWDDHDVLLAYEFMPPLDAA